MSARIVTVADLVTERRWRGIKVRKARIDEALLHLNDALLAQPGTAVETFGEIGFKRSVDFLSERLADRNAHAAASESQSSLLEVMSGRNVHGRGVPRQVLEEIRKRRDTYAAAARQSSRRRKPSPKGSSRKRP